LENYIKTNTKKIKHTKISLPVTWSPWLARAGCATVTKANTQSQTTSQKYTILMQYY